MTQSLHITALLASAVLVSCSENPSNPPVSTPEKAERSDEDAFVNPVDNRTYIAEGGWKEHKPETPRTPSATKVTNKGVRLLTEQSKIAELTSVESLASFIEKIEAIVVGAVPKDEVSGAIMVQFTCSSGSHAVELAQNGEIAQETLQTIYEKLSAMESLDLSAGEVKFQIEFSVAPPA